MQYRLRMQVWGGVYIFGLLVPLFLIWQRLLFMDPGEQLPEVIVLLSVDMTVLSPFAFALCSVASTLNYTPQHHLGAFVRARCVFVHALRANAKTVPCDPKAKSLELKFDCV